MLADEYILILSFISLSAHIQPAEFYQLLLLSSSSVFQSAAASGWTLKNTRTAASFVRYNLKKYDLDHIVLERGKVGESWRSQRWDSFKLNSPNQLNTFPGEIYEGKDSDGFASAL